MKDIARTFGLLLRQTYDGDVTIGVHLDNTSRKSKKKWTLINGLTNGREPDAAMREIVTETYGAGFAAQCDMGAVPVHAGAIDTLEYGMQQYHCYLITLANPAVRAPIPTNKYEDFTWLPAGNDEQVDAICTSFLPEELTSVVRESWRYVRATNTTLFPSEKEPV